MLDEAVVLTEIPQRCYANLPGQLDSICARNYITLG